MPAEDWIICRCEEVKLSEILDAIRQGGRDVDAVKRMTRAGMGLCQGRTCARLVSQLIARELGVPVAQVRQARQRLPVRPTPASLFNDAEGTRA
jgi:NAD(P)H-nitrite reductase large subunit